MGKLRDIIEQRLRVYMVPKADGGNHEDAYASLKKFCVEGLNGDATPESILATNILNDVQRDRERRRKARG